MAGEWKEVPLGELYEFSSGLSKPRSEFGFGHGFLSFKDVFYNYFAPERLEQLVNSTEKEQAACSIRRGDVFLTRTSETMEDLGMSCVALRDYDRATFNGFTKRLRPKKLTEVVPEYAGYFFRSYAFRRDVTAMSSLSTRASLNNEMLGRLRMLLPPVQVQEQVGSILKALDDKIEMSRRTNVTLEAMARALFQSWFVDFDPVRAKLDGRPPAALDPATAALFPSSCHETKLGHIPLGWEVGRLGDLCNLKRGHDLPSSNRTAGSIPVVSSACISGTHAETNVRGPGVVTGRYGTIGKVFYVETDYWPLNTTLYVENFRGNPPRFIFHALGEVNFSNYTDKAAVPGVNRNHLHEEPMVIPPVELRRAFAEAVGPLWAQHTANLHQSRTLATLRDTLLPKLLSGELSTGEITSALP